MPSIHIPSQLRDTTGGVGQIELPGATVRQIVAALEIEFPGIKDRLCSGDSLAPGLAVSVDGAISNRGLLTRVGPTSEVHFLPAFGGG